MHNWVNPGVTIPPGKVQGHFAFLFENSTVQIPNNGVKLVGKCHIHGNHGISMVFEKSTVQIPGL